MLSEKIDPEAIKDVNRRLGYFGHYDIKKMDSSRRLCPPVKLRRIINERMNILMADSLICYRKTEGSYRFLVVRDYIPDLPINLKFHNLTFSASGERLYVSTEINLDKRDLTFLGMGDRLELWATRSLDEYLHSQGEEATERARAELFRGD